MAEAAGLSGNGAVEILQGDAGAVLARYPAGVFDAVICDPPHEVLRAGWDVLPPLETWREIFRVAKPGAPIVAIGAPRTYHRLAARVELAGFVVEDMAVQVFATGRPPSEQRLKPCHAPILIARKPGAPGRLNIDEARLPFVDSDDAKQTERINTLRAEGSRRRGVYDRSLDSNDRERAAFRPKDGRWPANLIFTEPFIESHDRFFVIPKVRDRNGHPTSKPVRLLAHLIKAFVPAGGRLLDPFCGGGSTGVAAALTGRRAAEPVNENETVGFII